MRKWIDSFPVCAKITRQISFRFPLLSLFRLLPSPDSRFYSGLTLAFFVVLSISSIDFHLEELEPEGDLLGRNEIGSRIVNLSKLVLEDKESSKLCPMTRTRVMEIRGSRERETRGNCEGMGRGVIVKKSEKKKGGLVSLTPYPLEW